MGVGAVVVAAALLWTSCSDGISAAEDLVTQGDLAGAEAAYKEILTDNPDDARALDGLAVILMWQQRYEEAAVIQERAAASDKSNILVRTELGFNYLNHLGRPADAVRVFSETATLESTGKNLTFLAQAQTACGNNSEAERTLRKAIDADPTYAYSYDKLVGLLQLQDRAEEIEKVKAEAASHGVSISESE
ncbi:MAG: tetratricopeptide repeat protein [Actinomycetia bacterium]|nr:tetratricopeptide repeat protein [Actinomycetes bacterium]